MLNRLASYRRKFQQLLRENVVTYHRLFVIPIVISMFKLTSQSQV